MFMLRALLVATAASAAAAQSLPEAAEKERARRRALAEDGLAAREYGDEHLDPVRLAFPAWGEFVPADQSFAVRLPHYPEIQQEAVGGPGEQTVRVTYRSFKDRVAYAVAVVDFPLSYVASRGEAQLLDEIRDAAVRSVAGTLGEEREVRLGTRPAREVVVRSAGRQFDVIESRHRFCLVGRRVFLATRTFAPETRPDAADDTFFESLRILAE
jgi:hypothetical protein